ncbi:MAG: hypothetical protein E7009_02455 [Alphaproteobacteria bacterium]|nr:hypothetical protein [Alphaproteobacteria bacterium]
MGLNKNIFCATNPAKMIDALFQVMDASGVGLRDMLIFLPSRRAVRTVEMALVKRAGTAVLLPHLVALGEGVDEAEYADEADTPDVISNMERVVVAAHLLTADAKIHNLATALPIARDLVRMCDYLENEGIDVATIDWASLVDEKYATHFMDKAQMLNIMSRVMTEFGAGRVTQTQQRNSDIRAWINVLEKYKLVIVCGSTASVPPTADLMAAVARLPYGRIILSGKIDGRVDDFALDTNPYNSEYKFLTRIGCDVSDVIQIDVGASVIDFMNYAFGNNPAQYGGNKNLGHCHLIKCPDEAVEAASVAEIATRALAQDKSVLVITPDAAGNQRIAAALRARGIVGDFSGGVPGTMTSAGRAILNLLDGWIESSSDTFDKFYTKNGYDLFNTIAEIIQNYDLEFAPQFVADDAADIWEKIRELSNAINVVGLRLNVSDARTFIADAISSVSVRGAPDANTRVVVLGTIESRMQTADVVILTGLNEGMFPARGYENAWLPRRVAEQIGLPSPNRKVSLQSLDFMNLSCGGDVYWLRSTVSGGVQTTESRFISRIMARGGVFDDGAGADILGAVAARDRPVPNGLDYSPPQLDTPDWSDVYVTELETLIHNPYAFYVKHILRLKVLDDWWVTADAKKFGNLVHDVIEHATDLNPDVLVAQMDARAREIIGEKSVLFHFWHKRFLEIAPVVSDVLGALPVRYHEIGGRIKFPIGASFRNVRARADLVWDGGVMDFKTGTAPNKGQLTKGNMPQLPLEALMLKSGGFDLPPDVRVSSTPIMMFLQMKNGAVEPIAYDSDTTQTMIDVAAGKVSELFNIYTVGNAPYEYHETGEEKYKVYDDLARVKD